MVVAGGLHLGADSMRLGFSTELCQVLWSTDTFFAHLSTPSSI